MITTLLNLIKRVLGRFGTRDLGHFAAAFVGAVAVTLQTTTLPTSKAAWIALGSGALAVAFRQAFPNASVSPAQLESYVTRGEKILVGLQQNPVKVVTAPSNADILSAVAQVIAHASAAGASGNVAGIAAAATAPVITDVPPPVPPVAA